MKLTNYPVIGPDGSITIVEECTYDAIVEHIGSPFDTIIIAPGLWAYIRDNGLFDGSLPNHTMAVVFGVALCGPVMLIGGADYNGDTIPADISPPGVETLTEVANRIKWMHDALEENRKNPFTITEISLDDFLGGLSNG